MFKSLFSRKKHKGADSEAASTGLRLGVPSDMTSSDDQDKTVVFRMAPATIVVGAVSVSNTEPNAFEPATLAVGAEGDWDDRTVVLGAKPTREPGPPLSPGHMLNARYEVIKTIGRGGFSYVYLCQHMRNGRLVAVKEAFAHDAGRIGNRVTADSLEQTDIARDALLREVSAISRINHSGVVRFEDVFEQNDTVYFAMDYVEGEPLAGLLQRRGALSPQTLSITSKSLLDAVSVLHENDVMHGDIKPGNIFIRPDKSIVLIDFGTAARLSDVEYSSPIVSAGYSPPERYKSNTNLGTWSDVYSSAATIASAITGERPPSIERASERSAYIDLLKSKSPKGWADGLSEAMQLDLASRPSTVAKLSEAMGIRGDARSHPSAATSDGGSVFVSYAHLDSDSVEKFVREIQRNGIGVWIDRQGIAPGSPAWGAEIVKGMRSAETCLMFSSNQSMASDAVKDEIYLAKELGKPIIVARLDDAPFHDDVLMFLTRSQHIAAMSMEPSAFALAIRNVLNSENQKVA